MENDGPKEMPGGTIRIACAVTVAGDEEGDGAFADFSFYDEKGEKLYGVRKKAASSSDK